VVINEEEVVPFSGQITGWVEFPYGSDSLGCLLWPKIGGWRWRNGEKRMRGG